MLRKKSLVKINRWLLFVLFLFFPFITLADNASCEISLGKNAKNTLTKGDIVTINLGFDSEISNAFIHEMHYALMYDQNLFELVRDNNHYVITNWNIVEENLDTTTYNKNVLTLTIKTDDQNKMVSSSSSTNTNGVGSLKLRVIGTKSALLGKNGSTNVTLETPSFYKSYVGTISSENDSQTACNRSSLTLYIKSDDNTLSSIKVDNTDIKSCFTGNNNVNSCNYTIDSAKEKINIEVVKNDNKATVNGDTGTKTLKYGINTFVIKVVSEAGTTNTYNLYVNRPDNRSKINTLKILKLSAGIINFNPDVNEYTVNVENDVDEITITSSLTDGKSQYLEDYTNKKISLMEGNNKVSITVIAENGDENVYTISINRDLSGNNVLKELTINNEKIDLNNKDFSYKYIVENSITKVDIKAVAQDYQAKVEIENVNELVVGENEIGIYVTAANGDTVRYNLYVTRKSLLSENANLKALSIKGYKIDFDKDKKYYSLKIKDENSLDIEALAEDEKAEVTIEGNKDLINGSVIKINVKSEQGNINRYFLNIEKSKGINLLWIIIILIIFIIFGTVIIIVLMKDKDRKEALMEAKRKQEEEETNSNVLLDTQLDNSSDDSNNNEETSVNDNSKEE